MFCRFCGEKNSDNAAFCKKCGKKLTNESANAPPVSPVELYAKQYAEQYVDSMLQKSEAAFCPFCSAGHEYCHPIAKVNVKTSGGGYRFCNGCCGYILLGPIGLLCGACGSSAKTKVRNETWFVCSKCGKEFMLKQAALEKSNVTMLTVAFYSLIICFFLGSAVHSGAAFWFCAILALLVIGFWIGVVVSIEEDTGKKLDDLLTKEELQAFWLKFAAFCAASVIIGLILGVCLVG